MKKIMLFVLMVMGVMSWNGASSSFANEAHALSNAGNKICPVSKEPVGKMGDAYKMEYNGKEYNLCCKMCSKDFKKNPEKFAQITDAENMQTESVIEEHDHSDHAHS